VDVQQRGFDKLAERLDASEMRTAKRLDDLEESFKVREARAALAWILLMTHPHT
jgi:hypothetical protein